MERKTILDVLRTQIVDNKWFAEYTDEELLKIKVDLLLNIRTLHDITDILTYPDRYVFDENNMKKPYWAPMAYLKYISDIHEDKDFKLDNIATVDDFLKGVNKEIIIRWVDAQIM